MKGENYQRLNPSFVLNSLCVLYLLSSEINSETQQLLTKVYSFSVKLILALESAVKEFSYMHYFSFVYSMPHDYYHPSTQMRPTFTMRGTKRCFVKPFLLSICSIFSFFPLYFPSSHDYQIMLLELHCHTVNSSADFFKTMIMNE